MTLSSLGYVGYGVEVTEGTHVAPTTFLPVTSFSFEDTNDYIVPDQVRGSRSRSVALPAPFATSGTMDMELTPDGVAPLLRSAWAATVTTDATGAPVHEHLFTPGNTSPTFTFEASAADILVRRYGGIRVNTLEINAAFGEIVTASFGLEGTTRSKEGSASAESFTDIGLPFHFRGSEVRRGDDPGTQVATVKSFSFSTGNNIERIGTLRKTRNWRRTALGMFDVGLSATLDFTDTTEYDLWLAETEFQLFLYFESDDYVSGTSGPKKSLEIKIPRVRWQSVGTPLSGSDYLEQSAEALILKPASGAIFEATLTNAETSVA